MFLVCRSYYTIFYVYIIITKIHDFYLPLMHKQAVQAHRNFCAEHSWSQVSREFKGSRELEGE